jgi:hypothetical protein
MYDKQEETEQFVKLSHREKHVYDFYEKFV